MRIVYVAVFLLPEFWCIHWKSNGTVWGQGKNIFFFKMIVCVCVCFWVSMTFFFSLSIHMDHCLELWSRRMEMKRVFWKKLRFKKQAKKIRNRVRFSNRIANAVARREWSLFLLALLLSKHFGMNESKSNDNLNQLILPLQSIKLLRKHFSVSPSSHIFDMLIRSWPTPSSRYSL